MRNVVRFSNAVDDRVDRFWFQLPLDREGLVEVLLDQFLVVRFEDFKELNPSLFQKKILLCVNQKQVTVSVASRYFWLISDLAGCFA